MLEKTIGRATMYDNGNKKISQVYLCYWRGDVWSG